jgi:hypothetical protein
MDKIAFYKEQIYKQAKEMPKYHKGEYAIPNGYEPDHEEGPHTDEWFEGKVPDHIKFIANDGGGNLIGVDTRTDKNNPHYYSWDHETRELARLHDSEVKEMFSTRDNPLSEKLDSAHIKKYKDIDNMDKNSLKGFGYNNKDAIKSGIKSAKDALGFPVSLGAIGAGGGALLTSSGALEKSKSLKEFGNTVIKTVPKGALIGGGIGLGIGTATMAALGGFKGLNTHKKDIINKVRRAYFDKEDDLNFKKQYE